jgi:hypothetical protein
MDRVSVLQREVDQSADRDGQDARVASGQTMKIRVLGCSGGIGGGLRTTALLVDWPDFTQIPDPQKPFMVYRELAVGEVVEIKGRRFTAIPANHTVPAVGYVVSSARACLIYTGDTSVNDGLWQAVNAARNLKYLIIETAFPNKERDVAVASKHLCPQMLAEELEKMRANPEVYITHLKPGEGALTMREIGQAAGRWRPRMLENNQIFSL